MAMLWVLNLSDGDHSLLQVAERAGLPFALVADVAGAWRRPACSAGPLEGEGGAEASHSPASAGRSPGGGR